MLLPTLCAQHRKGNVVERATKLLGILPGSFAVAKTLQKGKVMQKVSEKVKAMLARRLVVLDAVPADLLQEWSDVKVAQRSFLELVMATSMEQASVPGRRQQAANDFLDFFAGHWTGPGFGQEGASFEARGFTWVG